MTRASFYLYTIPRRSTAWSTGCTRSSSTWDDLEFDQLWPGGHPGLLQEPTWARAARPRGRARGRGRTLRRRGRRLAALRRRHDRGGRLRGRGCAISQAATSMLTQIVVGRSAADVARMPKEELLEEIDPARRLSGSSARSSASACSRWRCTPEGDAAAGRVDAGRRPDHLVGVATVDVCPVDELPPGHVRIVCYRGRSAVSTTAAGATTRSRTAARTTTGRSARASGRRTSASPSARATADITTGRLLTLPAYAPVDTFPVRVEDGACRRRLAPAWLPARHATSRPPATFLAIRGKEVRQWRFPVRAVEVSAGRDVPWDLQGGIV